MFKFTVTDLMSIFFSLHGNLDYILSNIYLFLNKEHIFRFFTVLLLMVVYNSNRYDSNFPLSNTIQSNALRQLHMLGHTCRKSQLFHMLHTIINWLHLMS